MFSGIVEGTGRIRLSKKSGSNQILQIHSPFADALYVDQSIAHNGVCLTVESFKDNVYQVTAIGETLKKSNLGSLQTGDDVNLERSLTLGSYVDGHLVQGHVDSLGLCKEIREMDGSWVFSFQYDRSQAALLVEKGAITVNGISLTAHAVADSVFSVSIIPYTFHHTNLQHLSVGDSVNLEFDLIGKYVQQQTRIQG